jgi:hypothetical protein
MKIDPGMRFAAAWNKAVSFGNATEEFQCSRIFTYNGNGIPVHKFLPSAVFEVGPLLVPLVLCWIFVHSFAHCRNLMR